tara:strand:+ start:804 stop:1091 length:288 start_codon:yes stop_codon:yes gene_type:complete
MYEEVEIEIEIRGKQFDIVADVDYRIDTCESSSDCGDQWVTERWDEVCIEDIQIKNVYYWTDSEEYREIPINSLSKDDILLVNEAIQQEIEELNE